MSRSKRRKSGQLPYLLPINSSWRPRAGDQAVTISPAGDPRYRSTSLKSAYLVSRNLPIGPVIFSDFINLAPLTNEQCSSLQKLLGVPITKTSREEIDAAIYRLVVTIALSEHIPDWSGFRKRLRKIIKSGRDTIRNARQFVEMTNPSSLKKGKPKGTLSLDQAVKMYLWLAGDSTVNIRLDAILGACKRGLDEVARRASKRGPKADHLALRWFLQSLEGTVQSANGPTTLPSDAIRERSGPKATTQFFRFGRECLKLAITNGKTAISASSLRDDEKKHAQQVFDHLSKYTTGNKTSNGAFLSRWRDARRDARKNQTAN